MNFIKQTNMEIKNIFRSKFLLIIGILVLLLSIVIPVIGALSATGNGGYYPGGPIMYSSAVAYSKSYYDTGEEPVTIDGVTVQPDNPFYWNVKSLSEESGYIDSSYFQHPESMNLVIDMIDLELDYNLKFAQVITTYDDYRVNLGYDTSVLFDKFIYENAGTVNKDILIEALNYRRGVNSDTFDDTYVNITPEQRLAAIDNAETYLDRVFDVLENNDFAEYIAISIELQQKMIAQTEEQIKIQEETIIEHPEQEDSLNQYIEDMKKQIALIETSTIPILEYRLEKNIIPGQSIWQNTAISSIENANSNLQYTTIMSEEDYNKDPWLAQQYKTYARYKAAIQAQIDKYNNEILVAQNSLDADKPDMKFVPNDARNQTVNFLYYSIFVAMFGVILGGWLMASEFQLGTIRLLMIRPKTRTKIVMSKFTAALVICLGIYVGGTILNIITNGICFGFSDFGYPNYTASGEIGFIAYYLPKFLACIMPILFGYCVAFMLSMLVKNIAVSISVPIVCLIGCFIVMNMFGYGTFADWLAWTPIPYIQVYSFYSQYSQVQYMIENGAPLSLGYGLSLLAVLSVVCTVISVWVFRKRDITN